MYNLNEYQYSTISNEDLEEFVKNFIDNLYNDSSIVANIGKFKIIQIRNMIRIYFNDEILAEFKQSYFVVPEARENLYLAILSLI